jgi:hypothetical protein
MNINVTPITLILGGAWAGEQGCMFEQFSLLFYYFYFFVMGWVNKGRGGSILLFYKKIIGGGGRRMKGKFTLENI